MGSQPAIVTGAGNGIGQAVAIALARGGHPILAVDQDEEGLRRTVAMIHTDGGSAVAFAAQIGSAAAARGITGAAKDAFGTVWALVNVAGIHDPAPIARMSTRQWERVRRVHLDGPFHLMRAVLPIMVAAGGGRIINTVSRTGVRGLPPGEANYAAAKAGLIGLTIALAEELKPTRITVNAVSPVAWTRTAEALPHEERDRAIAARSAGVLGRVAMPDDVTPVYVFLASDDAGYVTGQIIQATGEPAHLL